MNFTKNIGFVDQVVRSLLILDVAVAYYWGFLSPLLAFVAIVFALALVGSCLTGHCPIYRILGLSTRHEYEDRHR